jgi:hypothetical protein
MLSIDTDRYPIDAVATDRWSDLVARCRDALGRDGMVDLPGFMPAGAVAAEVSTLAPRFATEAFLHERQHNIWFRRDTGGLAPDHPALTALTTSNRTLCADQLGGGALM